MKNKKFKTGLYQFKPAFGKLEKNLKKVLSALNNVNADLIVLPELPFTGYLFENRAELNQLAQDTNKSFIIKSLTELCNKNDLYIVTGFAEKDKNKLYNSSLLIGPKGLIHTYRKIHLFNQEKYWFDPGNKDLEVSEIRGIKVGMMICWDWIYPEVARKLTVLGADVICHPSNLVLPYCQYTMVSRSMENNVFIITANRIGADKRPHGDLKFTGKSQITGPEGKILFKAKSKKEELILVEIDINKARDKSITSTNDLLKDRRTELY